MSRAQKIVSWLAILGLLFPRLLGLVPQPAAAQGEGISECGDRLLDAGAYYDEETEFYMFDFTTSDQVSANSWHYDSNFDVLEETPNYYEEAFWGGSWYGTDGSMYTSHVDGQSHNLSAVLDLEQYCTIYEVHMRWVTWDRWIYFFTDIPEPSPTTIETGWIFQIPYIFTGRFRAGGEAKTFYIEHLHADSPLPTLPPPVSGYSGAGSLGSLPLTARYIHLFIMDTAWVDPGTAVDYIGFRVDDAVPPVQSGIYTRPLNSHDETRRHAMFFNYELETPDKAIPQPWEYNGPNDEEPPDPMLLDGNEYMGALVSEEIGSFVHAATGGVIESITDIDDDDCYDTDGQLGLSLNLITVVEHLVNLDFGSLIAYLWSVINQGLTVWYCDTLVHPAWLASDSTQLGPVDTRHYYILPYGQIVELFDDLNGVTFFYFVVDAREYVSEGQRVVDGCVLGRTAPLFFQDNLLNTSMTQFGLSLIWAERVGGDPLDIIPNLFFFPTSDQPCNYFPEFGDCYNSNPTFQDPGNDPWQWDFGGTADRHPDGRDDGLLLLWSGENDASQTFIGQDSTQYFAIKLIGHTETPPTGGGGVDVTVSLGDTDHYFTFPEDGDERVFTTSLAPYTDSDYAGALFDLSISMDTGQSPAEVVIDYLCVDTDADPPELPPVCLLTNYGFDDDSEWTLDDGGGPNTPAIEDGTLVLPLYTSASQDIDLSAGEYTVQVVWRAQPQNPAPIGGYSSTLDWEIWDGVSLEDSGSWTSSSTEFATETDTFTLASALDPATFVLAASATTDAAQVDYVCIIPPGDTEGNARCQSCPLTLVGDLTSDTPELVSWSVCRMENVYYCDMQEIITDTRDAAEQTVRGIGWLALWFYQTFQQLMRQIQSLAYYLGGYLANLGAMLYDAIAFNQGYNTTIIEAPGGFGFWDVLVYLINGLRDVILGALNTLHEVISMLLPLAGSLIDAALTILGMLSNLISTIIDQMDTIVYLLSAVLDAINTAEPTTIPGAPTCTGESVDFYCAGFYILDNTVFASPAAMLIPLIIAVASFNLIFWGIGKFRKAITSIS